MQKHSFVRAEICRNNRPPALSNRPANDFQRSFGPQLCVPCGNLMRAHCKQELKMPLRLLSDLQRLWPNDTRAEVAEAFPRQALIAIASKQRPKFVEQILPFNRVLINF